MPSARDRSSKLKAEDQVKCGTHERSSLRNKEEASKCVPLGPEELIRGNDHINPQVQTERPLSVFSLRRCQNRPPNTAKRISLAVRFLTSNGRETKDGVRNKNHDSAAPPAIARGQRADME